MKLVKHLFETIQTKHVRKSLVMMQIPISDFLHFRFFFHIVFLYYIILVGFRLVTFMYYDGVGDWDLAWGVAFCMVWGSPSFGTM